MALGDPLIQASGTGPLARRAGVPPSNAFQNLKPIENMRKIPRDSIDSDWSNIGLIPKRGPKRWSLVVALEREALRNESSGSKALVLISRDTPMPSDVLPALRVRDKRADKETEIKLNKYSVNVKFAEHFWKRDPQ